LLLCFKQVLIPMVVCVLTHSSLLTFLSHTWSLLLYSYRPNMEWE